MFCSCTKQFKKQQSFKYKNAYIVYMIFSLPLVELELSLPFGNVKVANPICQCQHHRQNTELCHIVLRFSYLYGLHLSLLDAVFPVSRHWIWIRACLSAESRGVGSIGRSCGIRGVGSCRMSDCAASESQPPLVFASPQHHPLLHTGPSQYSTA